MSDKSCPWTVYRQEMNDALVSGMIILRDYLVENGHLEGGDLDFDLADDVLAEAPMTPESTLGQHRVAVIEGMERLGFQRSAFAREHGLFATPAEVEGS